MIKIIVYAILFILGYRVLKRFFAPGFGEVGNDGGHRGDVRSQGPSFGDKSNVVEDVDYEEVD